MTKIYIQPKASIVPIALTGMLCTSPAGPNLGIKEIPTDDQW